MTKQNGLKANQTKSYFSKLTSWIKIKLGKIQTFKISPLDQNESKHNANFQTKTMNLNKNKVLIFQTNIMLTFRWSALHSFYGLCMQVAQPKKSNHVLLSLNQKCYRGGSTGACVGYTMEFVEAHQKISKSGCCFFLYGCVTALCVHVKLVVWPT